MNNPLKRTQSKTSLTDPLELKLAQLCGLQEKPQPFTPGELLFWNDPYISAQMLAAHLNPNNDLASRRPETIDCSIDWLITSLNLLPGASVLDLGCGPGLYSARLAQRGYAVTGVDYSQRSLEYAAAFAEHNQLNIRYRYQNDLMLEDSGEYDTAMLIYGDFCPLSSEQRKQLLQNVYRALKPGGHFILDVTTREHPKRHGSAIHLPPDPAGCPLVGAAW